MLPHANVGGETIPSLQCRSLLFGSAWCTEGLPMPTQRQLCAMLPCSTWPHAHLCGDMTKCPPAFGTRPMVSMVSLPSCSSVTKWLKGCSLQARILSQFSITPAAALSNLSSSTSAQGCSGLLCVRCAMPCRTACTSSLQRALAQCTLCHRARTLWL